jgi:hypothetical protein
MWLRCYASHLPDLKPGEHDTNAGAVSIKRCTLRQGIGNHIMSHDLQLIGGTVDVVRLIVE